MRSLLGSAERIRDRATRSSSPEGAEDVLPEPLREIMTLARTELKMEAAFIAEMSGGTRVIRVLDGDGASFGLAVDAEADVLGTLCQGLLDGVLPSAIPDARADPLTRDLADERWDVGAWVGVPIVQPDGSVYGTLCCLSHRMDPTLVRRDLSVMRLLARMVGSRVGTREALADTEAETVARIRRAIDGIDMLRVVLQPVVSLGSTDVVGFEALARFVAEPVQSPEAWFAEAATVGLGLDLEMVALRAALPLLNQLPDDLFLSVNVSPECVTGRDLTSEVEHAGDGHLVLELTEQVRVESYDALIDALSELRMAGVGLAIDDVGAGFSTMSHILRLEPDMMKLDASLIRGIEVDPRRHSLVSAMTRFADSARAELVAEGIETSREMETLQEIGVQYGQGFYIARPEAPARHLEGLNRRRSFVRWRR